MHYFQMILILILLGTGVCFSVIGTFVALSQVLANVAYKKLYMLTIIK